MSKIDIFKNTDTPLDELFPRSFKKSQNRYIKEIFKVLTQSLELSLEEKKHLNLCLKKYIKPWDSSFIFSIVYIYLYFKKEHTRAEKEFLDLYIVEHESTVYSISDSVLCNIVEKQNELFRLFDERFFPSEELDTIDDDDNKFYTVPEASEKEVLLKEEVLKDLEEYYKEKNVIKLISWDDHVKIFKGELSPEGFVKIDMLFKVILDTPVYKSLISKYGLNNDFSLNTLFLSDYLNEELLHSYLNLMETDVVYTLILLKYLNFFTHKSIYWYSGDSYQANIHKTVRHTKSLAKKYLLTKNEHCLKELREYILQNFNRWWD